MPKHLIRRFMPDHHQVRDHKYLRMFGQWLHDPNLWHLNRRSVSGAFFWGLFWAMIPVPFQMIFSAATAIVARVNLPIAVALVWLTNPITMPPIFYFCYLVGTWLLPAHEAIPDFQLSLEWIMNSLDDIWQPLYLGSAIVGLASGLLGYVGMRLFWRWHVIRQYRRRQLRSGNNTPSAS